jgi:hypothetical protein
MVLGDVSKVPDGRQRGAWLLGVTVRLRCKKKNG